MEDMRRQDEEETQNEPHKDTPDLPFSTKVGIFLGTAGIASLADVVGHWGITGLALGGFTAYALAKTSPQIYEEFRKHCGFPPARSSGGPGARTIWDRLTNQYPGLVEATEQEEQEDQPEIDDDLTLAEPHNDLPRFQQIDEPETHSPVPSLFTFSQVLMRFTPSLERLFLAMLPDGTPVFCAAEDLCHVASGTDPGGKHARQLLRKNAVVAR